MHVLQFSARAELWQTKVLVGTFEMCAPLRKCAVLCANVRSLCALGLPSIKVVLLLKCDGMCSFQKFLVVVHVYVCLSKKPAQNSKQPDMNAR